MIVRTFRSGAKRGRVFLSEDFASASKIEGEALSNYDDAEDREREPRLREALGLSTVTIAAHHGIDPDCARHVFVETGTGPVFACVIVPESWVESVLATRRFIYETFSFQVGQGEHLTRASTLAAFETWRDRNFPGIPVRTTAIQEWADDLVPFLRLEHVPEPSPFLGSLRKLAFMTELRSSPQANTVSFSLSSKPLSPLFLQTATSIPGWSQLELGNLANTYLKLAHLRHQ
jgi:hypothetical protein